MDNDDDLSAAGLHSNHNVSGSCLHRRYDDYAGRSSLRVDEWTARRARRGGLLLDSHTRFIQWTLLRAEDTDRCVDSGRLLDVGEALRGCCSWWGKLGDQRL